MNLHMQTIINTFGILILFLVVCCCLGVIAALYVGHDEDNKK